MRRVALLDMAVAFPSARGTVSKLEKIVGDGFFIM